MRRFGQSAAVRASIRAHYYAPRRGASILRAPTAVSRVRVRLQGLLARPRAEAFTAKEPASDLHDPGAMTGRTIGDSIGAGLALLLLAVLALASLRRFRH